jgi:uncharacterized protein (TIGR03083 family)
MNRTESMTAEAVWRATADERSSLADLLADLSESDWDRQSLCAEWRIRDVVAHTTQCTQAHLGWILVNLIRARGNVDRALRDAAIRHADRVGTRQLLDELRASVPSRFTPIATVPADRLLDVLVHGQDIAIPLGIDREMPSEAARLALDRVWATAARFGIEERLGGYRLAATDIEWARGDGPLVQGTAGALLLLATGRAAATTQLSGAGADALFRTV